MRIVDQFGRLIPEQQVNVTFALLQLQDNTLCLPKNVYVLLLRDELDFNIDMLKSIIMLRERV